MRYVYLLIGLLMIAGAIGFGVHRFVQNPDLMAKYERIIQGESSAKVSGIEKNTRSVTRSSGSTESDGVQYFQMALDVGNLVVGLVGIFLALTSMRGRRQVQH